MAQSASANPSPASCGTLPSEPRRVVGRLGAVDLAVGLTLPVLLLHAVEYRFLTDDAFISFRYARNFAQGYGLVFNPGFERVEGYSNFLWVLLLAGFQRLGVVPEIAAHLLSITTTVALWALVVWFSYRLAPAAGPRWLRVIPALFLAATRSIAVWSTSGLETRLFEVLIIGGVFRLIVELEAGLGGRRCRPLAALLFALATLTRPDGLLISLAALTVAGLYLARRRRLNWRIVTLSLSVYAVTVGGHFAFRLAYYGEWLPNTYYAKVGGRTWWDMGLVYLGMFALEYCVFLWLPLVAASVKDHWERRTLYVPLVFAAVIVPHLLYVAAIGGDHFEYRPLDLYFPFVFLLLSSGAAYFARRRWASWATVGYLLLVLLGLTWLPYRSHLQGAAIETVETGQFMEPDRDPLFRWPGLRRFAVAHRNLLLRTLWSYVGVRQEHHRLFLASMVPEGQRLGRLVARGLLPADTYVALSSVGAIPYFSNLRVLDRLGLTDAGVAHAGRVRKQRLMAHDKRATIEYARERGVELWAFPVAHLLLPAHDGVWAGILSAALRQQQNIYTADVGEGYYLVVLLPQGIERARRRFAQLELRSLLDSDCMSDIAERVIASQRDELAKHPQDNRVRMGLADMLMLTNRSAEAIGLYQEAIAQCATEYGAWSGLASARFTAGQYAEALQAIERAISLAEALGNPDRVAPLRQQRADYRAAQWERPVKARPPRDGATAPLSPRP